MALYSDFNFADHLAGAQSHYTPTSSGVSMGQITPYSAGNYMIGSNYNPGQGESGTNASPLSEYYVYDPAKTGPGMQYDVYDPAGKFLDTRTGPVGEGAWPYLFAAATGGMMSMAGGPLSGVFGSGAAAGSEVAGPGMAGWGSDLGMEGLAGATPTSTAGMTLGGTTTGGALIPAGASSLVGSSGGMVAPAGLGAATSGTGIFGSGMAGVAAAGAASGLGGLGGGGAGDMPGWLRAILGVGSGILGMNEADKVREAMDPFASERGYYKDRLRYLEQNPQAVTEIPGYKAGMTAVERSMASQGYNGSGNMMHALQDWGGRFWGDEVKRLAQLAGGGVAPGAGAVPGANLESQSLGSIGYGLASLFNTLGNNTTQYGGY